jgi:cold shock CspA family protein
MEISYNGLSSSAAVNDYIHERARHLERLSRDIVSCRVGIERTQHNHRVGNPLRVRVEINIPPGHDLVAVKERSDEELPNGLRTLVREVFEALEQQVRKIKERRRGEVKHHEEPTALVVRMDKHEGYGFLQSVEGEEYYFHKNSVLHGDFERLAIGTEVRFAENQGEEGPQASSVQIVNKPGARQAVGGGRGR